MPTRLHIESLEGRKVLAVSLVGGVWGADTGPLEVSSDLTVTFSEPVTAGGGGSIRLFRDSGTLVESFAPSNAGVRFVGNTLSINPTWDLDGTLGYYLTIDAGSVVGTGGGTFAGVSDATTLGFRTDVETPTAIGNSWMLDTYPGTSSESIGEHRALYMRATFPDINRSPNTLGDARTDMNNTSLAYIESSRGRISLSTTYTPVLTLPFSYQWLSTFDTTYNGLGLLQTAAVAEAARQGYNTSDYNVFILRIDEGLRGGGSWGGGDSVWVSWGGFSVLAHEAGHAMGLGHARRIDWSGTVTEYGSYIDWMGYGGDLKDVFGINSQSALGWIDSGDLIINAGAGVQRLYPVDSGRQVTGEQYGLRQTIPADVLGASPTYTLEYRPGQGGNLVNSVVLLRNDQLIDLVPGTSSQDDAGIPLGTTYQIPGSTSYFTVLDQAGDHLDVAYYEGPFADNVAPSVRLDASATTVKRFDQVTFTAEAVDANGDQLVYSWVFGDGVRGSGRTFSRSFTQAAAQNVTLDLTVSDMRGGSTTVSTTLAVGAASTGTPASVGTLVSPTLAKPRVAVIADDGFATEGGDSASFTISRIGTALDQPLVVQLAYAGTANTAGDFASLPATVTIPAGQSSVTVTLLPVDDATIEANESLTVSVVSSGSYDISGQNAATTVKVRDDDTPVVTIEATDATASEPTSSGRDTGMVLIRRSGPTTAPLTVYYGVTGSAFNGGDYGRLDGQVVIPAGASSVTLMVNPLADGVGEQDEDVRITLTSFNDAYSVGTASNATITIADGGDRPTVSVRATTSSAAEGGIARLAFNAVGGDGSAFTVKYSLSGTAVSGTDYQPLSGTITIPAGGTNRTVELPIQTILDGINDDDDTLVVTIDPSASYEVGLDAVGQVRIAEPIDTAAGGDRVHVTRHFTGSGSSALADPSETGTSAFFYVYRENATANRQEVTVTYTLGGTATPGTDYTGILRKASDRSQIGTFAPAASNTLTIPADAEGVIVELVPVVDNVFEGTETITLTVGALSGGKPFYPLAIDRSVTQRLLDRDTGSVQVGFETFSSLIGESLDPAGNVRQIYVTLNQASATPVTVAYGTTSGSTNALGSDWTFLDAANGDATAMRGTLTFAPGETRKPLTVAVLPDRIVEGSEWFGITLEAPVGASLKSGSTSHRVTIYDVVPDGLIKEERWSGTAVFTGNTWDSVPPATVDYLSGLTTAQNVGNDYSRRLTGLITAPATGTYRFYLSGDDDARLYLGTTESTATKSLIASYTGWTNFQQWDKFSSQKSAAISLVAGQRYSIEVQHKDGGGSDHVSVGWTGPGISTITPITTTGPAVSADNRYVRLLTDSTTLTEGGTGQILVGLDRVNPNASTTVELQVVAGGTAALGSDFSLSTTTVTFAPGELTKSVTVTALADGANESAEQVFLRLANASGAQVITPSAHQLTIIDANAPQLSSLAGYVTRSTAAGAIVTQMTATVAVGRTLRTWEILSGNPRVEGVATAAFAIDGTGRITLANPAAVPYGSYESALTVRGTDDQGSSSLALATIVLNGRAIVEERWSSTSAYYSGDYSATPAATAALAAFEARYDVADSYSRRITGVFTPAATGDYSFWIAARDAGRLTIAPADDPTNERTIATSGDVNYQTWDSTDGQQSPPQALEAGRRYILRAYQVEQTGSDHLSVAWSGPGFARQVMPAAAFLPTLAENLVAAATASNFAPAGVTAYGLDATAVTDTGVTVSIAAGGFTRDTTLGLGGTAVAGARVTVYEGATAVGQTVATGGTWALTTPVLGEGSHTFRAEVVDHYGNVAVTSAATFTVRSRIDVLGTELVSHAVGAGGGVTTGGAVGGVSGFTPVDQGVVVYQVPIGTAFEEKRWAGVAVYDGNTWDSVSPTYTGTLTTLTTTQNAGDNFSRRLRGTITAPATGDYTFYIASDDDSRLYLDTSGGASSKELIASVSGWTDFQQWTRYAGQKSRSITLLAGQTYAIEVQHKEVGGGDHVSVGWTGPGISQITPISLGYNLLVADGTTGAVQIASRGAASATQAADAVVAYGGTSPDGGYVVFGTSDVTAFGNGGSEFTDTGSLLAGPYSDLMVFDRATGTVRLATSGATATGSRSRQAEFVGITADSGHVIFTTDFVENIGAFTVSGRVQPTTWVLVDGGYPTIAGKAKATTLRVADIDPATLYFALNGGWITNKDLQASVSTPTVSRSTGLLSFWVQAQDGSGGLTKAVKLELSDTVSGILVKATAAKYTSGNQPNYNWNTSGTSASVATTSTASGYGVSILEARGSSLTNAMKAEGATGSKDIVSFNLATGERRLLSHSAAAGNTESQAANVGNVTLAGGGRYVLFTAADAGKFGNGGTSFTDAAPAVTDLFAADLQTGAIRLLSRQSGSATTSAGAAVTLLGTTADGSHAVFSAADASAFGFADSAPATADLFSVSLVDGTVQLISRAGAATTSAGQAVTFEKIVGGYAFFSSRNATAFGFGSDGDTTRTDLFRCDLSDGSVQLVSHAVGSTTQALNGDYFTGSLTVSADGRRVAFASDIRSATGGFTVSVGGAALFVADMVTGAIRILNSSNAEGTTLSYGAWGSVQNMPRSFTPDGKALVWQGSYLGWTATTISGYGSGANNQYTVATLVTDFSGGLPAAGTTHATRLLSHTAASTTQAASSVTLLGVSSDGRLAYFSAADASQFGNGGVAFTDAATAATDIFAVDLGTGTIDLVSGESGTSFGQEATLRGIAEGGGVIVGLGSVAGIGTVTGVLVDPNGSDGDLIRRRYNAIDLASGDDTSVTGSRVDNVTTKRSFALNSLVVPGMAVHLLDNGSVVAQQTAGAAGTVVWHLTNVAAGDHTYTLQYQAEQIPVRLTTAVGAASLTVTVIDTNRTPTDISLSTAAIAENSGAGAAVGTLTTADPDTGDTFTYEFVAGDGSADNAAFTIAGDQLRAVASLDYEARSSYSVRIRSTDAGGRSMEKAFAITVTDVNEAPTDVRLVNAIATLPESTGTQSRVKIADLVVADDDLGTNVFTLSGADAGSFEIVDTGLYLKAGTTLDYGAKSSYDVKVSVLDTTAFRALAPTSVTLYYSSSTGTLQLRNTSAGALSLESAWIVSPTHALTGASAVVPAASSTTLNTDPRGLYGSYSEILFANVGTTVLTLAPGGFWNLGNVAATGLSTADLFSGFATEADSDPEGSSSGGRFLYGLVDPAGGPALVRGSIVNEVVTSFTMQVANVPEFSGREYVEVSTGQTVVDSQVRSGDRQLIVRGGGTLVLAGANAHTGGTRVDEGHIVVRDTSALGTGALTIKAGARVTVDVGYSKVSVGSVSLEPTAKIDLGHGGLQIAAGGISLETLRGYLVSARNGGLWDGYGIGSANAKSKDDRAIGYRRLSSGVTQVAWAAFGDVNLDGRVNSTDVTMIITAKRFNSGFTSAHWYEGDFTYDGRVSSSDVSLLTKLYNKGFYNTEDPIQSVGTSVSLYWSITVAMAIEFATASNSK